MHFVNAPSSIEFGEAFRKLIQNVSPFDKYLVKGIGKYLTIKFGNNVPEFDVKTSLLL